MKQEIATESPGIKEVKLEYMLADLSCFDSVKDFTVAFRERNLPLHVLINNAATVCLSRGKRKFVRDACIMYVATKGVF